MSTYYLLGPCGCCFPASGSETQTVIACVPFPGWIGVTSLELYSSFGYPVAVNEAINYHAYSTEGPILQTYLSESTTYYDDSGDYQGTSTTNFGSNGVLTYSSSGTLSGYIQCTVTDSYTWDSAITTANSLLDMVTLLDPSATYTVDGETCYFCYPSESTGLSNWTNEIYVYYDLNQEDTGYGNVVLSKSSPYGSSPSGTVVTSGSGAQNGTWYIGTLGPWPDYGIDDTPAYFCVASKMAIRTSSGFTSQSTTTYSLGSPTMGTGDQFDGYDTLTSYPTPTSSTSTTTVTMPPGEYIFLPADVGGVGSTYFSFS